MIYFIVHLLSVRLWLNPAHVSTLIVPHHLEMIKASSHKYEAPPEFETFARQFHQDLMDDVSTEEELIEWVLSPLKGNAERQSLRAYLDSITQDDVTDEELRKLWWSSRADFVFYDGAELRAFLKRVRAKL